MIVKKLRYPQSSDEEKSFYSSLQMLTWKSFLGLLQFKLINCARPRNPRRSILNILLCYYYHYYYL